MKNLLALSLLLCFLSKVHAQEITTFPGFWGSTYYQDENKLSKMQLESLMLKSPEANVLWQKAKSHETIGLIALVAQSGLLIWGLTADGDKALAPLIGSIAAGGVAIGYTLSSSSLKKKSILKYNSNLKSDTGSLMLSPTYNGMGLVYSF